MSVSVRMPQLGESVTEGTVTRWLKKEGDLVRVDEPLLEVSTDKVDTEIPSPASGVLNGIAVAEEETVEVGAELAVIEEEGAQARAKPAAPDRPAEATPAGERRAETPPPAPTGEEWRGEPPAQAVAPAAPAAAQQYPRPPTQLPGTSEGPYITPLVRKLAVEHGVDLASVQGTGVGGRIRKQDVLDASRAAQQQWPAAPQAAPPRPAPEPSAPPAPATAQPAAPAAAAEPAEAAPAAQPAAAAATP